MFDRAANAFLIVFHSYSRWRGKVRSDFLHIGDSRIPNDTVSSLLQQLVARCVSYLFSPVAAVVELDDDLHLHCLVADNEVRNLAIEAVAGAFAAGREQRAEAHLGGTNYLPWLHVRLFLEQQQGGRS